MVDYSKIENQIHYRAFRKGHAPQERFAFKSKDHVQYILEHSDKKLMIFNVIVKCPVCGNLHLIPKFKYKPEYDIYKK